MKHTKEPWAAVKNRPEDDYPDRIKAGDGRNVAFIPAYEHEVNEMKANAQRIVECVNAMAGVADPASAITAAREALEGLLANAPAPHKDIRKSFSYTLHLEGARAALAQLKGVEA